MLWRGHGFYFQNKRLESLLIRNKRLNKRSDHTYLGILAQQAMNAPLTHGIEMKKPILTFTSIAVLAVAALAGTLYLAEDTLKSPAMVENTKLPLPPIKPQVAAEMPPEPSQTNIPVFDTVRVEDNGEAVIAGRAEPDADVTVKWNGAVIGSTKSTTDGSFVVIPAAPLAKGSGALTLEVSKNGKVSQSAGSVMIAVKESAAPVVAKVDPAAPTQVLQTGDASATGLKELQLSAVDYDAAGNIVFSGKAAPGTAVRFYVDNLAAGEGMADAAGNWSFRGTSAVSPGNHTLRADALDGAGKVISRVELPFLREAPAKIAASQAKANEPDLTPEQKKLVDDAAAAAAAVVQKSMAEVPDTEKIVIQPGNSLWKLSRDVYGKGRMYTIIYEANRDQLKNPNKIFPGQILTAPKQN
jgi:nucleoid-associated protein YgaU